MFRDSLVLGFRDLCKNFKKFLIFLIFLSSITLIVVSSFSSVIYIF